MRQFISDLKKVMCTLLRCKMPDSGKRDDKMTLEERYRRNNVHNKEDDHMPSDAMYPMW